MYRIAVLGDRDSVLGFKALGLEVYPVADDSEARNILNRLAGENCAVIYVTEQLALNISADIDAYKESVTPAIIVIPGKSGSLGTGMASLKSAVERAVGANIL